jgi:hypothetical protein
VLPLFWALGSGVQNLKEDEKEKISDAHQKRVNSLQRVCSHFALAETGGFSHFGSLGLSRGFASFVLGAVCKV